jgi:hypothetical protein
LARTFSKKGFRPMHNHLAQSGVQVTNGAAHIPARAVDFFISSEGPVILVLPITPAAEVWANVNLGSAWLGAHWVEGIEADEVVTRLLAAAFVLRLDGKLI